MAVEKGNKIKVEYTGTLEDGTVFDASEKHGQPLEFQVGSGQLIKGFDEGVIGMEVGDEKELNLQPEDAYGPRKEEMIRDVPKDQLPKEQEIKADMMLIVGLPNGMRMPVKVVEVQDDIVKIDFNHQLAGKVLNFKIKVIEIGEGSPEGEHSHEGCCCGDGECSDKKECSDEDCKDENCSDKKEE